MPLIIPILVIGLAGVLYFAFDRKRYRGSDGAESKLRPSGEIFIDPGSGKKMQVLENPTTGERKYRQINGKDSEEGGES